uniref:Proline-rich AKT1 substrate 1 N-terminal domain-containing protein n=1 Tax=Callorhinchus milii TaxID=7868 RepID=A0A4W3GLI1_CALMI
MAMDMVDNHRESWDSLVCAAEKYRKQTGNDVVLVSAYRPRLQSNFAYAVNGTGALADATKRHLDDIAVFHKTSSYSNNSVPAGAGGGGDKGTDQALELPDDSFSKSYPSIYGNGSFPSADRQLVEPGPGTGGEPGVELLRDSQGEEEEEEVRAEGEADRCNLNDSSVMFVMDEESTSQDCEPFFESDLDGESTDDGSLSEDLPVRGQIFAQVRYHQYAKSLPVSVPIWGFKDLKSKKLGDGDNEERAPRDATPREGRKLSSSSLGGEEGTLDNQGF